MNAVMTTLFDQWLIDIDQLAYDNDVDVDLEDTWWLEAFRLDLTRSQALSEYLAMKADREKNNRRGKSVHQ